jgi:polyhydroxybutyrate depolymerase
VRVLCAVAACAALAAAGCGGAGDDERASGSRPAATATAAATATRAPAACARNAATPPAKVPGAPLDTILRAPAAARGRPTPLVVALHFAGGTGAEMESTVRLTPEARRSGFAVAYPSATEGGFWRIGNDLGALARTLDAIERVACIDTTRVYAAGISNGGFMAAVLACRMAGRIAAVALFAPGIGGIGECRPSRPVPVLEVHGTADPIVPYGPVPAFVAGWAARDGCSGTPSARALGGGLTRLRWPRCRAGARVEHLRLARGRHVELLAQLRTAGIDPARTAWRFLAPHRLAG